MTRHEVVSKDQWFRAHKAHLAREKALTHFRDQIAAERRALPWMKIEKTYQFDTVDGPKTLADLFDGRSQLIVYHFMFPPGADYRCLGCSLLCDHIDGASQHLKHHDVSLVVVGRGGLEEMLAYRRRMGWRFEWVSSGGGDFNYDFDVSFTEAQLAAGEVTYNFEPRRMTSKDLPGTSVFYKDEAGDIFLTFEGRSRGGDILIGVYNYLDFMPLGRNEPVRGNMGDWARLHDEYDLPRKG